MISAKDALAACELIDQRVSLARDLVAARSMPDCIITIGKRLGASFERASARSLCHLPPETITEAIRLHIVAGAEKRLADIDARLRALGVEPPEDDQAGSASDSVAGSAVGFK